MQVGGVGSGHDTYSHHVTSCLHEHGANTDTGSMGTKSGAAQTAQMATEALQENSKGNLLSWVQNIGNSGKQLLQKIWGDSKESNDAISSQKDGSGGDGGYPYVFPACGSKGCHAGESFSESALSGTEGSQKTDGPAAGTIPGIP